jgi:hypothetical protein
LFLGNDPLPIFSFYWYALLVSANSMNILVVDHETTHLY